jgi:hypothetical protein
MRRELVPLIVTLVAVAPALPVCAQVMTSVERRNASAAAASAVVRIAPAPLGENAVIYADRTHVYRNVPPALVGAQYLITAMEDKDAPNLELHIKIGQSGTLYLILDNRVGTNVRSPTATPNPGVAGMGWMTVMGFKDTGLDMAVDESANGTIDNYYSVFSIPVAPGEVILGAQNDRFTGGPRDRSMYGVAAIAGVGKATKPVPADGETMVVEPLLTWTPGATAAFHNVYLGTTPQLGPADLVGSQVHTPVFHGTQLLTPGVTYYWRVDEIGADKATTATGDVWSFTAASATAYGPVPADGATWVDQGTALAWKTGKDALEANTTYFWRIDEVAATGAKQPGPVWSFTTMGTIPIDDPSLLAWWRMDEGAGSRIIDWSGHGRHATLGAPAPA